MEDKEPKFWTILKSEEHSLAIDEALQKFLDEDDNDQDAVDEAYNNLLTALSQSQKDVR